MSCSSLKIFALIWSGPIALWMLRFCKSLLIPEVVIEISGIIGCGDGPLSGRGPSCSMVKTDLNCVFRASAFCLSLVTRPSGVFREFILAWSFFNDLM